MSGRSGVCLGLVAATCLAWSVVAAQPGKANGAITIDGVTAPITHAVRTTRPNAFDETSLDTVIVLSDRPLGAHDAGDEARLFARAARGELVTMALRFDERRGRSKLFNVAINAASLPQTVLLPDVWFQVTYTGGVGRLTLASREFDGRTYAAHVEFAVAAPADTTSARTGATAAPSAIAALPPPSRTDRDRTAATALLIAALQEGDESRALAIVALGVDPNGRDEAMNIPVINWAVLMCQPLIVKALVELKADLTHERLPGMTLLAEAIAACPDAAPFLRAGRGLPRVRGRREF